MREMKIELESSHPEDPEFMYLHSYIVVRAGTYNTVLANTPLEALGVAGVDEEEWADVYLLGNTAVFWVKDPLP